MAAGARPQRRTVRYWRQQIHLWIGIGVGGAHRFLVFVSGVIIAIFAVTGLLTRGIERRTRRAGERAGPVILHGAGPPAE